MPDLTTIAVSILSLSVSITSFMLFLVEHRKSKESLEKQAQQALFEAQGQSQEIVDQAVKKAQTILGQAEAEELRLVHEGQGLTQKFEQAAEKQLQDNTADARQQLNQQFQAIILKSQQAQQEYLTFLSQLRSQLDQTHQASLKIVEQQINSLFDKFEQNLSNFLLETQQKTIYSIDLELKATRELINTYKQQQLKLIDDNVVAILERTLSLVLAKKLDIQAHSELITEALEKAKIEKFIA